MREYVTFWELLARFKRIGVISNDHLLFGACAVTENRTKYPMISIHRLIKVSLFVALLVLMMTSALYLKDNAAMVLANADPITHNEQLCYSSCTFMRPINALILP